MLGKPQALGYTCQRPVPIKADEEYNGMNSIIDFITGRPREAQDMESIQQAIDELQRALDEAFGIREELKEK